MHNPGKKSSLTWLFTGIFCNFASLHQQIPDNMMQAMIFAAGLGTRLKPLTDTMPKALVRVGDEPLIKRVLLRLADAGAGRIVVNVHHFASQITQYLAENDNFGLDIVISDETSGLLETGGGIKHAASLFAPSSPVLIHNVDILSNVDLRKFYNLAVRSEAGGNVTDAVLLVSWRKTKRYLLFDDNMRLVGWTNVETGEVKSPYANLDPGKCLMYAFAGIHVISPRLFPLMDEFPDRFGIIDFYLAVCATHNITGHVKGDLKLMDIGKLDTLAQAESFLSEL